MTLNTSRKDAITYRREMVARLRLRGLSTREIIKGLAELTPPCLGKDGKPWNVGTIHTDLKALDAEWRARAAEAIDERKARQLAEIDEAKRRAWAAGDLQTLARFIKLESDIFGTAAAIKITEIPWDVEARKYGVKPEQFVSAFEQVLLTGQVPADAGDAAE